MEWSPIPLDQLSHQAHAAAPTSPLTSATATPRRGRSARSANTPIAPPATPTPRRTAALRAFTQPALTPTGLTTSVTDLSLGSPSTLTNSPAKRTRRHKPPPVNTPVGGPPPAREECPHQHAWYDRTIAELEREVGRLRGELETQAKVNEAQRVVIEVQRARVLAGAPPPDYEAEARAANVAGGVRQRED